jgi:hypothetical protein
MRGKLNNRKLSKRGERERERERDGRRENSVLVFEKRRAKK